MKFDIKAIARTGGAVMEIEAAAAPDRIGLAFPGFTFDPADVARFHGSLQNAGHGILVLSGTAAVVYHTHCARCLAPIRREIQTQVRETFRPAQPVVGEHHEDPQTGDDEPFYVYEDYAVDITDAVRENLLPALPIRALCQPDCAGICPRCGADLNRGPCACPPADPGERNPFGRLKELL